MSLRGEKNPRWKGGRTITQHGYVLINVGKDHHLAHVNGYAYEHRIVAERTLGRRLRSGEQTHHIDGNKTNNDPPNIMVVPSIAHHRALHRSENSNRRLPNEPNRLVRCECGCGQELLNYDDSGRPRTFVSGHNPQEAPLLDLVEKLVCSGADRFEQLVRRTGTTRASVSCAISRLAALHKIVRCGPGVYGPPGSRPLKEQITVSCECGCGSLFDKYDASGRPRRFVSGHNMGKGARA